VGTTKIEAMGVGVACIEKTMLSPAATARPTEVSPWAGICFSR